MCVCFNSKGSGDLYIKASLGILSSETYELCDAIRYINGTVNFTNWTVSLPSHYEIRYKLRRNSNSNVGTLNLWRDNTHAVGVGLFNASSQQYGLGQYNGSSWNVDGFTDSFGVGVTKEFIYTYDNGSHTLEVDGSTKTLSLTNSVIKIDCNPSGSGVTLSDFIIKPL